MTEDTDIPEAGIQETKTAAIAGAADRVSEITWQLAQRRTLPMAED